ncbi:hypothetical protein [Mesorhizobium sp. B2-3-5]|uniref:hypothetical protein n=1 Tax=Mesorhizobium sp. B2-3-5 TaxID=2589958 RepID=UPI00112DFE63|nr:hypothetical protein [Mesorhizobium sp. B2-3-5]TPM24239.1 hypothetical protein FJ958_23830 [Mesorhizobium sp. B2-3-5]
MPEIHIDRLGSGHAELTLWELLDPAATVRATIELYGPDAATAAAWCALTANFDGRDDDYRFWCRVFSKLRKEPQA